MSATPTTPSLHPKLPWWTWVLPLLLFHAGTQASLHFKLLPGVASVYIPTSLGIVLIHWWGPRILLPLYVNAILCVPLWDLEMKRALLYALPETLAAVGSWGMARLMRIDCAMHDRRSMMRMLAAAVLLPGGLANLYLYNQLVWFGDIPAEEFALTLAQGQLSDLMVFLMLGVPLCALATDPLRRRGWALPSTDPQRADALIADEFSCDRRESVVVTTAMLVLVALAMGVSIQQYWYLYAVPVFTLALTYGHLATIIATTWMLLLVIALPAYVDRRLGATWRFDADHVQVFLNLCTLALAALITGRTISDLRRQSARLAAATDSLSRSERFVRLAVEAAGLGAWIYDVPRNHIELSPDIEPMLGLRPGQFDHRIEGFIALLHPDDVEPTGKAIRDLLDGVTSDFHVEFRIRRSDGSIRWYEARGDAQDFVDGKARLLTGVVFDITDRKRLEASVFQAQKMDSLGRLAGGVAHDFNNLLTAILGFSEILQGSPNVTSTQMPLLKGITDAAQRGAGLTQQLLGYARRQVAQQIVLDLNERVEGSIALLRRIIGEDIDLQFIPGAGVGHVRIDPVQFEQLLINLAVNARDAMPMGGKLTIETHRRTLDATYCRDIEALTPGDYAMLSVGDTGHGIPPDVLTRIFEPFFTTRPAGQGTGLGLATCFGVVKQSRGHITVYSEVGTGTTFKVYLPVTAEAATVTATAPSRAVVSGNETVLLVEDERLIRELIVSTLTAWGFHMLSAADGVEALEKARQHDGPIHLLVTDVVMPRMGGKELAGQLQSERPALIVLYTSGYTENAIVHHGVLDEGIEFLSKPYSPAVLARRIRELLGAAGS